ncbi:hypothetical protein [Bacillus benzoevorans]|nr:hypothetical protein [Bacillus benzoevorans]
MIKESSKRSVDFNDKSNITENGIVIIGNRTNRVISCWTNDNDCGLWSDFHGITILFRDILLGIFKQNNNWEKDDAKWH